MIETPLKTQMTAQLTATIHLQIPRAEMPKLFGPAVNELMRVLGEQGVAPLGPVFAHHFSGSADTFDFEVGVPVAATVVANGRVRPGQVPAAPVVKTIYRGPYEALGDAWGNFDQWIKDNGLAAASDLWEVYVKGPESGDDATAWETELIRPLANV
jgi:effector-binding domain-containing protein